MGSTLNIWKWLGDREAPPIMIAGPNVLAEGVAFCAPGRVAEYLSLRLGKSVLSIEIGSMADVLLR